MGLAIFYGNVYCFNVSVAEQLSGMYGAVKMLYTRVRLIVDYLRSVRSGKI